MESESHKAAGDDTEWKTDTANATNNNSNNQDSKSVEKKHEDERNDEDEPTLFNLKRPKDLREGLGGGIGNIFRGVVGGAAVLVSHLCELLSSLSSHVSQIVVQLDRSVRQ